MGEAVKHLTEMYQWLYQRTWQRAEANSQRLPFPYM